VRRRLSAALALAIAVHAAPAAASLTGLDRLRAAYDAILDARFADAEAELADACPPAPAGACDALGVVALWWQIQLDPDSRAMDQAIQTKAAAAIAGNQAWTVREPDRAEAWFYLAGSYGPLVEWRVLRGQRLSAAREGNRIREALQRAIALDPTLQDAYFGIGLYHYYAGVASAGVKFLRWLLMLPGGDRAKGLQEMLTARDHGELLTGEADYQLHLVYLWYEHDPVRARQLLEQLDARHGSNPLFLERIATIEDEYFHDHPASAARWRELGARAAAGRTQAAAQAQARAQLGLAGELDALDETDRAIDQLLPLAAAPADPFTGARAEAALQLAEAYDRLGERGRADAEYGAAIAAAPPGDPTRVQARAQEARARPHDPRRAAAYRASLDGWRALERGDVDRAVQLLTQAVAGAPEDLVARYRRTRALEAAGRAADARAALETIVAATPAAPAFVRASAIVDLARAIEPTDRARATSLYREASTIDGADPRARDDATRALRRLQRDDVDKRHFF
jgi:hypothetical protein